MPRDYLCARCDSPIEIDGCLNKAAWLAAPWTEPFVDIMGGDAPPPPLLTRVKMLWDSTFLYIGAMLDEPHVWATLTQRDSIIFQDNDFEVFIDPDGDNHQYYELELNALNTVWDLLLIKPYRDGGPAVHGWDIAGLKTAVFVNGSINDPTDIDSGWSVEIALPWSALKECANRMCPPAPGDTWRMNFSRVQWETSVVGGAYVKTPGRPEDNWVWSPHGVVDMHRPESWGYVTFIDVHNPSADDSGASLTSEKDARELLMRIYYAQKQRMATSGSYTNNVQSLALNPTEVSKYRLTVECMTGAFVASATIEENGSVQRWCVREDSRIWRSGDL